MTTTPKVAFCTVNSFTHTSFLFPFSSIGIGKEVFTNGRRRQPRRIAAKVFRGVRTPLVTSWPRIFGGRWWKCWRAVPHFTSWRGPS